MWMRKAYVEVLVRYTREGQKIPILIIWEDGRKFSVDRVLDIRRAASLKAGGQGIRYRCRICSKETFLWFEEGKWFVEAL